MEACAKMRQYVVDENCVRGFGAGVPRTVVNVRMIRIVMMRSGGNSESQEWDI